MCLFLLTFVAVGLSLFDVELAAADGLPTVGAEEAVRMPLFLHSIHTFLKNKTTEM